MVDWWYFIGCIICMISLLLLYMREWRVLYKAVTPFDAFIWSILFIICFIPILNMYTGIISLVVSIISKPNRFNIFKEKL